ncbi:MAG: ATP-binding cassette domain-containing protein [Erysipelotrichaceae bacterium]|nr:ATP-binding cassette domain-containing protein [Erysipelotrichaceae bacterium]
MIEIKKMTKVFNEGTINEKVAIADLDLKINDGDFICIIGANGSGKSTLLNCLSGALIPEKGNIIIDGKDVTLLSQNKRAHGIGHLFQDPLAGTAPHMSIEENLALAAKSGQWLSTISEKDRRFFKEKLARLDMGLEDKLSVQVATLSGGMRQALTLVMNTIKTPRLLLLDEHTAALDPETADKVLKMTRETIEEKKITCVMITHNMQTAIELGNRLIMMNDGKIILDLNKEEKEKLTIDDLREMFRKRSSSELDDDRMILS